MNGAEALVRTLADCGVTACFANPGTSEMHLVTALDREPRIRSVLCLFEGCATGAADGFARIAGRPAMTLLHLGPGYLNGGANLHNAKRAHSPIVNVVGDHATYHRHLDAPLTSDIEALVKPLSVHVDVVNAPGEAGPKGAEAYKASFGLPGGNAFLILPADSAWNEGGAVAPARNIEMEAGVDAALVRTVAAAIKAAKKPALIIGGDALATDVGLEAAARLDAAGVKIVAETFPARTARGAGRYAPAPLAYFAEQAVADLEGVDLLVAAGTKHPVAFFAYPGRPSELTPEGAKRLTLRGPEIGAAASLAALADEIGAPAAKAGAPASVPDAPKGKVNAFTCGASLARHLPEGAIVCDDGVTSGGLVRAATAGAPHHDWLALTGGAIGIGLPLAIGAAVAAPERKVISLNGDGAGMYTNQALWTMAREKLDVLSIVFANRSYRILNVEMTRTGAGAPGPTAQAMLSLDDPAVKWAQLAEAQGVESVRCETAEDFEAQVKRLMARKGPALIEAVL
jgi:acetolactate synthase-1/2/3 large subunit